MEQIGKYAIVGQIGTGGFGVVYEGRDPFLKRRVAIKTCSSEESDIRDRFFREAEIAGNLQHRNIVTVHDFGIQDGVPYLVQEYLTGEDLDRVVARRDPLAPAQRVDILVQAARGLEYAHAHGVIHRDVKPANIRLTSEGIVRIMDFGIAKLSNVASHLTRTGMTLGTAAYLPPEQIRGTTVDHRADIFSFGVTAYELLTYHRPFVGKTISALFWELLQREPEPLTNFWPACPPALEQIVMRCLAKDPNQRYTTFTELIPDLEDVLAVMQQERRRGEPGRERRLVSRGEETTARQMIDPPTVPDGVREIPTAAAVPAPPKPFSITPPPTPPANAAPTASAERPEPAPAPPPRSAPAAADVANTTVRRVLPKVEHPKTEGGLLGVVEEALASAHATNVVRRAREALARGDLDFAERELIELPAKAGADVVAVRRDVARGRADQLLAQAAAQWQQGEPQAALAKIGQLLALMPDHQDAQRLRESWRAELAERERAQAQTNARRAGIGQAVAEAESLLASGDVESAEAVVAAAQANFGSHQPLRDLRRRIGLARDSQPSYDVRPVDVQAGDVRPSDVRPSDVKTDVSTLGVAAHSIASARKRVEAESRERVAAPAASTPPAPPLSVRPRAGSVSATAWPRPGEPAVSVRDPAAPTFASAMASEPDDAGRRTRLILIAVGAAVVLALLVTVIWIATHRKEPVVASPAPTVAPSIGGFGMGVPSPTAVPSVVAPPDRDASVLQQPTLAYPAGVPRRATAVTVRVNVLVSAQGEPLEAHVQPGTVEDPRLIAEAERVARRSRYLPAVRGGAPAEQTITVDVKFAPK
jgi:TonB family protein